MSRTKIISVYVVTFLVAFVFSNQRSFSYQAGPVITPLATLKYVEANINNAPDGQGDYVTTLVSSAARVVVRAGNSSNSSQFKLYITYDGLTWLEVDSKTVGQSVYGELRFGYLIADPVVIPGMRANGHPFEFNAISGIKVTCDDGSGVVNLLTVNGDDPAELYVSLMDGEFENPNTLTVEALLEWRHELIWPEPDGEDLVVYTIGQPGTIPLSGQSIPADCPLAMDSNDSDGAYEVWRFKRCSGSWGVRFEFFNFPEVRLQGDDENIALAILVRGALGNIDAISDSSFESLEPQIP
jgi:hypothetical protein